MLLSFITLFSFSSNAQNWNTYMSHTNFDKYAPENKRLLSMEQEGDRIIFMGNSITEMWPNYRPAFFKENNYICRGIGGQTTPQMLLRFRQDVINLSPKVVVLLAGINDIAGNTGPTPIKMIYENIISMVELARYNEIEVVLCSVLPAFDFPWRTGLTPAPKVIALNTLLEDYANVNKIVYVDYHSAMKDEHNGLRVPEFTTANDLVHPNVAGYKVMENLVQPAIERALAAKHDTIK